MLALSLEGAHLLLEALDQLVVGAAARPYEMEGQGRSEGGTEGECKHGNHAPRVLPCSDGLQQSPRTRSEARFLVGAGVSVLPFRPPVRNHRTMKAAIRGRAAGDRTPATGLGS